MIISPGRQYIFVHIPKTGGTSMAMALEDRAHKDDILIGDTPKAVKRRGRLKKLTAKGRLWKHSSLADIDGVLSPEEIAQMCVFTLVRNPWDRVVSYYHWLQHQSFEHSAVLVAKNTSFRGFVAHPQTAQTLSSWHYARYVTDVTGREHGRFLRLEHLTEDKAEVEAHLGFSIDMPHENRSERATDYREYYDADLAELVGKICAKDIKRFGYSYGG